MTTMLVGLVTNAVSDESRWPGWLGWLQEHACFSFVVLGVTMAGLTALLAGLTPCRPTQRSSGTRHMAGHRPAPPHDHTRALGQRQVVEYIQGSLFR
ncbi:hypothetical protein [Streptomyces sporangiiformans]|uniref:hypothetical protein n=1 Tax=Streptomyces sporangiiformans TaxID=2315329 RepID=UPI001F0913C7|nr:hypothetical protein [Streptomyces sporangiiformans]